VNTKLLLGASAIVLGAAGIAGTFAPHEVLTALGITPAGALPVLVQLLAAVLFGFSMLNWAAKGSLIGGIYNRPVAIGNLTHFVIGALALVKAVMNGQTNRVLMGVALVYAVFAVGFAMVLFRSPVAAVSEQP
jgi:hypothetical protein